MIESVTAGIVEPCLEQALDLTALEQQERTLLHRPDTPEPDSVVELLAVAMSAVDRLGRVTVELAALNGVELQLSRDMAGWADGLVTSLRDAERNGPVAPLTGRALAIRIRPQLALLADDAHATRWPQARGALHDIFAAVPADVIFRHAVTYQLGADKTAQLMRLHDAWTKKQRGRRA